MTYIFVSNVKSFRRRGFYLDYAHVSFLLIGDFILPVMAINGLDHDHQPV
jgi:hypothetical protein